MEFGRIEEKGEEISMKIYNSKIIKKMSDEEICTQFLKDIQNNDIMLHSKYFTEKPIFSSIINAMIDDKYFIETLMNYIGEKKYRTPFKTKLILFKCKSILDYIVPVIIFFAAAAFIIYANMIMKSV
ncbi:Uncharacterised protein [Campylobacter hyointestinalis subsp. hyointestinalis]|uniref:Uncharacterized protein n=2 Tax=Campylobacter hyointestinalis TaxID=198 RepID=A0A0S4SZ81_CAMHY|nr:Uncharacterised protein [Campylobacter hyointestinalis subsp. hyointestinalis]